MNLQGRDLRQDLNGNDVRLLHSELIQLGLTIPDAELQRGLFGPGTREIILNFQKQHSIPTTGVVDAVTATEINRQVGGRVAVPNPYTVAGRVFSDQRAGT